MGKDDEKPQGQSRESAPVEDGEIAPNTTRQKPSRLYIDELFDTAVRMSAEDMIKPDAPLNVGNHRNDTNNNHRGSLGKN